MTKRREPLTYQRTLTTIAARIGWDRCAAICGVNERSVRYWSDPDCETEIRMIDAERLDRAFLEHGGDHAPFHRLHGQRLDLAEREATARLPSLSSLAGETAREAGEAVAAMIQAAGNVACCTTRRAARAEIEQAIGKLQDSLTALNRAEQETAHVG